MAVCSAARDRLQIETAQVFPDPARGFAEHAAAREGRKKIVPVAAGACELGPDHFGGIGGLRGAAQGLYVVIERPIIISVVADKPWENSRTASQNRFSSGVLCGHSARK